MGQTATWLDGRINITTGGTFDNLGTFSAEHTGNENMIGGTGREFNNSGTFTKSGDAGTLIFAPFNNSNTTDVQTGTLFLRGGGTSTGAYNVSAGATLQFGGGTLNPGSSVAGAGTVRLSSGIVNINGTYDITGTTLFGGTVNFNPASTLISLSSGPLAVSAGTVTFNSGESPIIVTTLTQSGGTITGTDDITASGLFTWSGGTHGGTGITTANGGISIATFSNKTLGRTLTNPAGQTATMSGAGFLMSGGPFNNDGTFNAQQTVSSGIQGSALSHFNNSGTFTKSEDGSIVIAANFNNTGTLDVLKGTLLLFRTANATGAYNVSGGATLEFTNAPHFLNAGSTVAGLGTVRFSFSFGLVNINGTYNVTGTTEFTGGIVTFNPSSTLTSLSSGPLSVSRGTVTFNSGESPINVTTMDLSGGTITGSDSITASGLFTWTGSSTMSGAGATTANAGMILNSDSTMFLGRTLTNPVGQTTGWLDGDIDIRDGGTFNNAGTFDAQNDRTMSISGTGSNTFNNSGTVVKSAGAGGAAKTQINAPYTNTGTTRVQNGTLSFGGTYTQTAGATLVDAGATLESLLDINISGGIIGGGGTIVGNVNITGGGAAAPGLSTAVLTITGDYTQTATGALDIEIGGLIAGDDYDQLVVNGTASLAGTLNVTLINAFVPDGGDSFLIFNGTTTTGSFDTVNLPAGGGLDPGQLVVGGVEAPGVCGDVNGDDAVNVLDAITILQIIVGLVEPTTVQLSLADLNQDGSINVLDAITVLQIIVGLTQVTQCGPPPP